MTGRTCLSLDRLLKLRELLRAHHLQAYILPAHDDHFNEYVAASDKRCAFLSGFAGSACTTVVTLDKAALWTDGRYHEQAKQQLDENWTLMRQGLPDVPSEIEWIVSVTDEGAQIGYDARQFPSTEINVYQNLLRESEISAGALSSNNRVRRQLVDIPGENLVDKVWSMFDGTELQRPIRSANPVSKVSISFAGRSWEEKVALVLDRMKKKAASHLVLSMLDEIAWLLNLRGSDISFNPVFFAYLILSEREICLFIDSGTVATSPWLPDYLKSDQIKVTIEPYSEFFPALERLSRSISAEHSRIWFSTTASQALVSRVESEHRLIAPSPVDAIKVVKTDHEIAGIRRANLVDSLILCDFIAWLEAVADANQTQATGEQTSQPLSGLVCPPAGMLNQAPPAPKYLTESSLANYIDSLRQQEGSCVSPSFRTIFGVDANGAIVHYKPVAGKDLPVTTSSLCLIDSGGQYTTGTTDVTRTVSLGQASAEVVAGYTLVLKAHIALANQVFPSNIAGSRLDVIARLAHWQNNADYQHGTGHGVGAYLCVHEGPIGISGSRLASLTKMGLREPGIRKNMVVTIEPGLYLTGHYGIRLENVVVVVAAGGDKSAPPGPLHSIFPSSYIPDPTEWLTFDYVTLVPFQRDLIMTDALSEEELRWLNTYHANVRRALRDQLAEESGQSPTADFDVSKLSASRQRCWNWILKQTESL